MRIFNICSEYYIYYIICAFMYAEIMWGCSYTCMYVIRCVYIRTNANLVSVRTRLIGASLSEPHTSNSGCMYLSMYLCVRHCPPEAPDACTQESYSNYCTLSLYSTKVFAVDVMESSYELTVLPHF